VFLKDSTKRPRQADNCRSDPSNLDAVPPSLHDLQARPRDREQLLVYADWLQACGDARGELIAVQDLAATTTSQAEFEHARARARTLVETVEQLRPPLLDLRIWAVWERGFVRRLELSIDRYDRGEPNDWDEQLATILDHPSLALIEYVLVRVQLPEATYELGVAGQVSMRGLARWRTVPGPRPPMQLDVWTTLVPGHETRQFLVEWFPELRPYWFSTDITMIPPPRDSLAAGLEAALNGANSYGHPLAFDLLWFDTRGHFLARVEAHSASIDRLDYESAWQVHVRRLAEQRPSPIFDDEDPLVSRRLAHLFDHLAARFQPQGFTPRLAPSVEAVGLSDGLARLEARASQLRVLASATLARFDGHVDWYWVVEACHGGEWAGLIGLSAEQIVVLAATPNRPAPRSPHE
jgi:uncharacterized protein (TIGR02996 family)